MNIVIKTMGCKANRYESDKLFDSFSSHHLVVDANINKLNHADLIVVNTCTVTHVADRKSRQAIVGLKKKYPSAKVVVFGCGANVDKEGYKNLPNVDFVFTDRKELSEFINNFAKDFKADCKNDLTPRNRTRALIKIQDGCNNFCTYCIVPIARGRERSKPHYEVLKEINSKVEKGYKEIVLTGINIGAYNENNKDLADLIELILENTKVERLRLSSIEPQNFSSKYTKLFNDPRFCPHLHISLQSGCDSVLKRMRRRYDSEMYKQMVDDLRNAVPHISITTDVIVGFPGETEGQFNETINFVKKLKFSKIHIFPYSKRDGTLAATMDEQVNEEAKKKRCEYLSTLEAQMRSDFYERNQGRIEEVLIEQIDKDGCAIGFTKNYLKTRIPSCIKKQNQIVELKLNSVNDEIEMIGSLKT